MCQILVAMRIISFLFNQLLNFEVMKQQLELVQTHHYYNFGMTEASLAFMGVLHDLRNLQ